MAATGGVQHTQDPVAIKRHAGLQCWWQGKLLNLLLHHLMLCRRQAVNTQNLQGQVVRAALCERRLHN